MRHDGGVGRVRHRDHCAPKGQQGHARGQHPEGNGRLAAARGRSAYRVYHLGRACGGHAGICAERVPRAGVDTAFCPPRKMHSIEAGSVKRDTCARIVHQRARDTQHARASPDILRQDGRSRCPRPHACRVDLAAARHTHEDSAPAPAIVPRKSRVFVRVHDFLATDVSGQRPAVHSARDFQAVSARESAALQHLLRGRVAESVIVHADVRLIVPSRIVGAPMRYLHPERVRVEVDTIPLCDVPTRALCIGDHHRDLPGHAQRAVPLQHLCPVKSRRPRDHIDRRFYLRRAVAPVFPVCARRHTHMRQTVRDGHASGRLLALALYQCSVHLCAADPRRCTGYDVAGRGISGRLLRERCSSHRAAAVMVPSRDSDALSGAEGLLQRAVVRHGPRAYIIVGVGTEVGLSGKHIRSAGGGLIRACAAATACSYKNVSHFPQSS